MWTDDVIDSGDVRLAVRDYGGTGRSLVLLHGGPGQNLATWDRFVPYLSQDFRTVALDLRGNGASSDAADYSYPALVSDVHAVVSHYRLGRPVIVGHSWGGQVAVFYASQYHECAGVVGIDGWFTDVGEALPPETWRWLEDDYAAEPFLAFAGTAAQLDLALREIERQFGPSAADVMRRQFTQRAEGVFRWRRTVPQFVNIQRRVAEAGEGLNADVYRTISCPVLLIGAERSEAERREADPDGRLGPWGFSRAATEPVARRFPHVRAEWWPCGHDIPHELPDRLAQALRDFAHSLP